MENNTWELVKLPEGRNAIGCKWVFRVKYDGKGQVERFKGRLVAKGTHKSMVLTMTKPSLLLQDFPPSALFLPLQSKWE